MCCCTLRPVMLGPVPVLVPIPMADTVSSDPITFLVNYGVAGIVVVLLVLGKLRTKAEVDGLIKANDQLREDLKLRDKAIYDLTLTITNHTLPSLTAVADKTTETEVLSQVLTRMGDLTARLEDLTPTSKGRH